MGLIVPPYVNAYLMAPSSSFSPPRHQRYIKSDAQQMLIQSSEWTVTVTPTQILFNPIIAINEEAESIAFHLPGRFALLTSLNLHSRLMPNLLIDIDIDIEK